jgi:hypothetical protein
MTWRPIAGGVLGFALWWFLFFAIGIGIGMMWPEYREAARVMFQEADLSLFATPMLFANLFLFVVAGIVVGCISTLLGKSRIPTLVLAALFLIYTVINHYILEWEQLPPWYNLIVPVVVAGSIWLGGRVINLRTGTTEDVARASAA